MFVAAILNGLRVVTALAVMVSAVPFQRAGLASYDHGRAYAEAAVDLGQVAGHTHTFPW